MVSTQKSPLTAVTVGVPVTSPVAEAFVDFLAIICVLGTPHVGVQVASLAHDAIRKAKYFIRAKIIADIMQTNSDITHAIFCSG